MDSLEQVLGISINGEHRAYSLNLLSRHKVVNNTVGRCAHRNNLVTAMLYGHCICPRNWRHHLHLRRIRQVNDKRRLLYDHQTNTLWSQFLSCGVQGPLSGTSLEIVPSGQTTWEQRLALHRDTLVLN